MLPPPASRSFGTALGASLLLHAMLLVKLSGLVGAEPDARAPPRFLSARLTAAPAAAPELPSVPEPLLQERRRPEPRAAPPAIPLPAAPRLEPIPPQQIVFGRVTVGVEQEGPLDAQFKQLLAQEHANAQRVPLEFAEPPVVDFPVETLRDIPQRRLRTLVRVHEGGEVEFLRTDEYDHALILAIREALERTRARPANHADTIAPGWAIVDFWFELSSPLAPR